LRHVAYFVFGYFLADHADLAADLVRRGAAQVVAAVVWLTAAIAVAAYWAVPLANGTSFDAIAYRYMAVDVLALPMGVAAFVVLVGVRPHEWLGGALGWLVRAAGLYAYGVYYLHVLMLMVIARALTGPLGLARTGFAFYASAFALGSIASVLVAKLLARLPFSRYLV
jgi:hypothetical protein